MQKKTLALWSLLALLASAAGAAEIGTAFTYQGRLCDGGIPATGYYDFTFKLYAASSGGAPLLTQTAPLVPVTNGLFMTSIDFGATAFLGQARWLEILACTNDLGAPVQVGPRQELQPTPYALHAGQAATATSIPWTGLTGMPAGFLDGVDNDTTYTAGPGLALTGTSFSLDMDYLGGRFWYLGGNAGTVAGTHFLGTADNQPLELKVNGGRAFRLEPNASLAPNVIGGAAYNVVGAGVVGATIAGGGSVANLYTNQVLANYGTIGGGSRQLISPGANSGTIAGGYLNELGSSANSAAIGGGRYNAVAGGSTDATIAGGYQNAISTNAVGAAVGGGRDNTIATASSYAVVSGGYLNEIGTNSDYAMIGGGYSDTIFDNAPYAVVNGGYANSVGARSEYAVVTGGSRNNIAADSPSAFVGGGYDNDIGPHSDFTFVGGGYNNDIVQDAPYSTILGGRNGSIGGQSDNSTLVGGWANVISTFAPNSFIGGGLANGLYPNTPNCLIGGGLSNNILNFSSNSVVVGGWQNTIDRLSYYSFIGGGYANLIATNSYASVLAGGTGNRIDGDAHWSTLSGGRDNLIGLLAPAATIVGGGNNVVGPSASYSSIGGGAQNQISDHGIYATIPGGYLNAAAGYSFAAGYNAHAHNTGAFVWSDGGGTPTDSYADDSVTMRARGGFYFITTGSGFWVGAALKPGETSWSVISDRNVKKDFTPLDHQAVLEKLANIPVTQWHYQWEDTTAPWHIGPVAQEFKAAFYPGGDDKSITTLEADGVALAAIKGLNEVVKAKDQELQALKSSVAELKQIVQDLLNKQNGGGL